VVKEGIDMIEPRSLVEQIEREARLPASDDQRFAGYGAMGLPFASGHIIGPRRWPVSSVGDGFTTVWYRNPHGEWPFYSSIEPLLGCTRYFGSALTAVEQCDIQIQWAGPRRLSVVIGADTLRWDVDIAPTPVTQVVNAASTLVPDSWWRYPRFLKVMQAVAGPALRLGRVGLRGDVPNGQWFQTTPRLIWSVPVSEAVLRGVDLGLVGPLRDQARLGDFWLPQRGVFFITQAFVEPFDPACHLSVASQTDAARPRASEAVKEIGVSGP
jgi:hypothetical protein